MKFKNIYRIFILTAATLFIGACSKFDNLSQDEQFVNIELLFNVKDVKSNNVLGSDCMGYIKEGQITAEYKGFKYILDGKSDIYGGRLVLVNDRNDVPKQLGFGPIPGNVPAEEEPLTINIGSDSFTVLITNVYEQEPDKPLILRREIVFKGKDYYSGMTTIDLIVNTVRQKVPIESARR